jgi:hypothetical protein
MVRSWAKNDWEQQSHSLAAWDMVCMPKDKGGLWIINLELHNDALFLKYMGKFINKMYIPWVDLIGIHIMMGRFPKPVPKLVHFGGRIFALYSKNTIPMTTCQPRPRNSILRWKDKWNGTIPLALQNSRLFSIALTQTCLSVKRLNLMICYLCSGYPCQNKLSQEFQLLEILITGIRNQSRTFGHIVSIMASIQPPVITNCCLMEYKHI